MKRTDRKSDCAINFSLESFGDPWSLLILRDMVFFGKRTYGAFLASDERIGTSILARRLKSLEDQGILTKRASPEDGRSETYHLAPKGLDVLPILFDLMTWGAKHDPDTGANGKLMALYAKNRQGVLDRARKVVEKGGSVVQHIDSIFTKESKSGG